MKNKQNAKALGRHAHSYRLFAEFLRICPVTAR